MHAPRQTHTRTVQSSATQSCAHEKCVHREALYVHSETLVINYYDKFRLCNRHMLIRIIILIIAQWRVNNKGGKAASGFSHVTNWVVWSHMGSFCLRRFLDEETRETFSFFVQLNFCEVTPLLTLLHTQSEKRVYSFRFFSFRFVLEAK